ncbi:MAG: M48 family metallopeptidase [Bacteriovoracaceae bacterium]|nr:M48 family metallopeptidase [Bacteriovoracaceae bacterium]
MEIFLDYRQITSVKKNRNNIPHIFEKHISLEEHHKAQDYTLAKCHFSILQNIFESILLLFWTWGGGLLFLENFMQGTAFAPLLKNILLVLSFSLITAILTLPFSLYHAFVLEVRFGFNRMTIKTFFTDKIKGLFLSLFLGIPLLAILFIIIQNLGNAWWFYAWLIFVLFQLILTWAYPRFIAPWFNRFTMLPAGDTRDKIEELLSKLNFPKSHLWVMDASKRSSHGNAYFTGFGKNKKIVLFDTLVERLNAGEITAVLAHELGHFKLKHILKMLIFSSATLLMGFFILGQCYHSASFLQRHSVFLNEASDALYFILFSLVVPLYTFILTPIGTWISRRHEFEADFFANQYTPKEDLIKALLILQKENASTLTPDSLYANFYYSHPALIERMNAMNL